MIEVMCWFPVVEDFIAILYRREKGGKQTSCEEDVECAYGREAIGCSFGFDAGEM
jgi:hypothetical protein